MSKETEVDQMVEGISEWLANGAPGADTTEKECFGTVPQDLALGYAQEILDSVGLPTKHLVLMAQRLE